ncbi:uncharacterized protein (DUF1810 family) [Pararhizobium capsulatum DSM 1112]|uniref:Uncharacterized protein (DUF1810 family) n=1 Tax=Pararhizobium capsulatum DSM 1112 TaxID=1121113 RepID=A0ABU0BKL2_9HYPH|nr:DUF1810 domain-containing protein [Pararhizobium capsulatum]MDQ0318790.1 uncharacterized protein (DUF1810 family) [Pararhizobium capsulatum DSM 1112]
MQDNLQCFVDAQAPVYDAALGELRAGHKTTHWMWFIFPQIAGLGHSSMAQRYAISGLEEAKAYLSHPLLGQRLRECTEAVCATSGRSAHEIFGSPDDMKFRSSMTLFAIAAPQESIFGTAIERFFDSEDSATLDRLAAER